MHSVILILFVVSSTFLQPQLLEAATSGIAPNGIPICNTESLQNRDFIPAGMETQQRAIAKIEQLKPTRNYCDLAQALQNFLALYPQYENQPLSSIASARTQLLWAFAQGGFLYEFLRAFSSSLNLDSNLTSYPIIWEQILTVYKNSIPNDAKIAKCKTPPGLLKISNLSETSGLSILDEASHMIQDFSRKFPAQAQEIKFNLLLSSLKNKIDSFQNSLLNCSAQVNTITMQAARSSQTKSPYFSDTYLANLAEQLGFSRSDKITVTFDGRNPAEKTFALIFSNGTKTKILEYQALQERSLEASDGNEFEWAFRIGAGPMAETEGPISMAKHGIQTDSRGTKVLNFEISRKIVQNFQGWPIDLVAKLGFARQFEQGLQPDFTTYHSGVKAYYRGIELPGFDGSSIRTRLGFGWQLSYSERIAIQEQENLRKGKQDKTSRWMSGVDLSADFNIGDALNFPDAKHCFAGVSMTHRSGAFGLMNGVVGGGDAYIGYVECLYNF